MHGGLGSRKRKGCRSKYVCIIICIGIVENESSAIEKLGGRNALSKVHDVLKGRDTSGW